jgi:hypothetical protein
VTVEAVSADTVGTIEFPKTMAEIIKNEDYVPQQIFSVDESELWWKKKNVRSLLNSKRRKTYARIQGTEGEVDTPTWWKSCWGLQNNTTVSVP